MTNHDHVRTEDSDGRTRHTATTRPNFKEIFLDGAPVTPPPSWAGGQTLTVPGSSWELISIESIPDGTTATIEEASMVLADATGVPSGVDLGLVTLSEGSAITTRDTILSGDGFRQVGVTGDLATWQNDTGFGYAGAVAVRNNTSTQYEVCAFTSGNVE